MHLMLAYPVAAGAGVLIAHFVSRAPELRFMRLSQLILVPAALVLCVYVSSEIGGLSGLVCFVAVLGLLVVLLAPNIAHLCGTGLVSFLDPQDWTPAEEEIALKPIRRLIDKDQYHQALSELDDLLKKRKPTYEALLLKAKLLNHLGGWQEAVATLLSLIELSQTTDQQLMVMGFLDSLEDHHPDPPTPLVAGGHRMQIRHELVLYPMSREDSPAHKTIPPGGYKVEATLHREHRWLKLAGEDWGNYEVCWEAVRVNDHPAAPSRRKDLFRPIARMHQAIGGAFKRKRKLRRHVQAEAQRLFHEANEFIRREDWQAALPLLQKASSCDPDRYEIAYRWAQAVRNTASDAVTAQVISQVLQQSLWTESEQYMLQQLKQPLAK